MPMLSPKDNVNMMLIRKMKGGSLDTLLWNNEREVSLFLLWTCQMKGYYPHGHFINLLERLAATGTEYLYVLE